jgi:hypothetical protein
MNWLLIVGTLLVALWIVAEALGWVIGAVLNVLWIGALILAAVSVFQKLRASPQIAPLPRRPHGVIATG